MEEKRKKFIDRLYSNKEKNLLKALTKQKKISEAWCSQLESTNLSLKRANEKLHIYKLANKGHFEIAVEAEATRRIKEMWQPMEEAIELNLNSVVCMLKNLTDMKTLVTSLSRNTYLENLPSIDYTQAPTVNSNQKTKVVERRRNIVHPMVKGHVLQPAMINIPRLSLPDNKSCIITSVTPKRRKNIPERRNRHKCPPTSTEPSEITCDSNALPVCTSANTIRTRNNSLTEIQICNRKSGTENVTNNSANQIPCENKVNKLIKRHQSTRKDDPLEGPSWLYNGAKKKNGQNRREILDRIKKGIKPSFEFRVCVDSDSDTELEKCHSVTTGIKRKHRKIIGKGKNIGDKVCRKYWANGLNQSACLNVRDIKLSTNDSCKNLPVSTESPGKLPIAKDCFVVLKREQTNFGLINYRTSDSEPPSDKENIPPNAQATYSLADGEEIKLRTIAVVIEDIMRTRDLHMLKYKVDPTNIRTKRARKINMKYSPPSILSSRRKRVRNNISRNVKSKRKKINFNMKDNLTMVELLDKSKVDYTSNSLKSIVADAPCISFIKQEVEHNHSNTGLLVNEKINQIFV